MENAGIVWRAFIATVLLVCGVLFFLWIATPAPSQERVCQPIDEMITRTAELHKQRFNASLSYMRMDNLSDIQAFLQAAREAGYPHPAEDQVRHLVFFASSLNPEVIHIAVHTEGECFIGGAMMETPLVMEMLQAVLGRIQFTPAAFTQAQYSACPNGGTSMGSPKEAAERLEKQFGETPIFFGVLQRRTSPGASKDSFFIMFLDRKDGSWTFGYYQNGTKFCGIAAGGGGLLLNFDNSIQGEPV